MTPGCLQSIQARRGKIVAPWVTRINNSTTFSIAPAADATIVTDRCALRITTASVALAPGRWNTRLPGCKADQTGFAICTRVLSRRPSGMRPTKSSSKPHATAAGQGTSSFGGRRPLRPCRDCFRPSRCLPGRGRRRPSRRLAGPGSALNHWALASEPSRLASLQITTSITDFSAGRSANAISSSSALRRRFPEQRETTLKRPSLWHVRQEEASADLSPDSSNLG